MRSEFSPSLLSLITVCIGALATAGCSSDKIVAPITSSRDTSAPLPTAFVTFPPVTITPVTIGPISTEGGRNPLGGNSPEDKLMPDLVCMNLQDAQDEIQDHGVFLSRSEDATGKGRHQIWDRNWTVVDQDPKPGTPIGERDAVLFVVKDGEQPNPC